MFEQIILVFSAAAIALHMGTHIFVRSFYERHARKSFWFTAGCAGIFFLILSLWQYRVWASNPFSAHFLPPVSPISYFLQYVFFRIWSSSLLSFVVGWAAVAGLRKFNAKKGGMLLHEGEEWLAGSAVFLSGFPGLVFFIPVFLVLFLLVTAIQAVRKGSGYRVSPLFLWFPTALCVILLVYLFFTDAPWWTVLRI